MQPSERGSSLIEIVLALTILSVGLLGLAGTSAGVNRMIAEGRWATVTMGYAERRIELLRATARDSTSCSTVPGGSAALPGGLTEHWSVVPGVHSLAVEVIVTGRLSRADTVSTVIQCR